MKKRESIHESECFFLVVAGSEGNLSKIYLNFVRVTIINSNEVQNEVR